MTCSYLDNKYLHGKSDQNKDEFDVLLFAVREIKKIFFYTISKSFNLHMSKKYLFYPMLQKYVKMHFLIVATLKNLKFQQILI